MGSRCVGGFSFGHLRFLGPLRDVPPYRILVFLEFANYQAVCVRLFGFRCSQRCLRYFLLSRGRSDFAGTYGVCAGRGGHVELVCKSIYCARRRLHACEQPQTKLAADLGGGGIFPSPLVGPYPRRNRSCHRRDSAQERPHRCGRTSEPGTRQHGSGFRRCYGDGLRQLLVCRTWPARSRRCPRGRDRSPPGQGKKNITPRSSPAPAAARTARRSRCRPRTSAPRTAPANPARSADGARCRRGN